MTSYMCCVVSMSPYCAVTELLTLVRAMEACCTANDLEQLFSLDTAVEIVDHACLSIVVIKLVDMFSISRDTGPGEIFSS